MISKDYYFRAFVVIIATIILGAVGMMSWYAPWGTLVSRIIGITCIVGLISYFSFSSLIVIIRKGKNLIIKGDEEDK